jgi:hypothetical protein
VSDLVATPDQVAEALHCSIDVVRDLKRDGRLPHVMLTRVMWVVPWVALQGWLEDDMSTLHAELAADGVEVGLPKRKGVA